MKAETIYPFKLKALGWVLIIAAPLCSMGQEISEAEKEEIKALNRKRMELYQEGKFDEGFHSFRRKNGGDVPMGCSP